MNRLCKGSLRVLQGLYEAATRILEGAVNLLRFLQGFAVFYCINRRFFCVWGGVCKVLMLLQGFVEQLYSILLAFVRVRVYSLQGCPSTGTRDRKRSA